MKTKNILLSIILGTVLLGSGCTDGFDAINTNPNDLNQSSYSYTWFDLTKTIRAIGNYEGAENHQRIKALSIDAFVQYTGGHGTTRNYGGDDGWQGLYWRSHYVNQLSLLNQIIDNGTTSTEYSDAQKADIQNAVALSRICRVWAQSLFTDYFGPTPFPLSVSESENAPYMSIEQQHTIFFNELDAAVKQLDSNKPIFPKGVDQLYKGNLTKWKRFANTLRLRLAIKLSEINPELCKTQIRAAIESTDGLLQSGDDAEIGSMVAGTWGQQYPYYMYQVGWGEKQSLMAAMQKALTNIGGIAYDGTATIHPINTDPRASKNFDPSTTGNKWVGMTPGKRTMGDAEPNQYAMMSNSYILQTDSRKEQSMTYVEVCFLAAEAAERFGIMYLGKTSESWYNEGVSASFKSYGLESKAASYLTSTKKNEWGTSASWNDVTGNGNSKLEKIVTQRYIAFYPDLSLQIWNDKRRLNLPALDIPEYRDPGSGTYPNDNNIQNPANYIQRTIYPQRETQVNSKQFQDVIKQLRDGDKTSSPIWWASKQANYCTSK